MTWQCLPARARAQQILLRNSRSVLDPSKLGKACLTFALMNIRIRNGASDVMLVPFNQPFVIQRPSLSELLLVALASSRYAAHRGLSLLPCLHRQLRVV